MNQSKTKNLTLNAFFIALTIVMLFTPLGTLRLPFVSVTIAHIPMLVATLTLGLRSGLVISLTFGLVSLFIALTAPNTVLDPFFVNPLISILPRLLIPITTYYVAKLFDKDSKVRIVVASLVGNLTNTFGVYTMLYLIYAQDIFEKTGVSALTYIISAMSVSTVIKSVIVVLIVTPTVYALRKVISE